MRAVHNPMPTVEFDGKTYSLRSRKTEVPDLHVMARIEALVWLCRNTTPRGYSRAPNPFSWVLWRNIGREQVREDLLG
jgi:hypothetical protein